MSKILSRKSRENTNRKLKNKNKRLNETIGRKKNRASEGLLFSTKCYIRFFDSLPFELSDHSYFRPIDMVPILIIFFYFLKGYRNTGSNDTKLKETIIRKIGHSERRHTYFWQNDTFGF